ncbi:MAG: hypothetical protein ABJA32_01260 [Ginsengibacter sp.]
MQTLTIDILNYKAEKLLEDLEHLQLIRVRKERHLRKSVINWTGNSNDSQIDKAKAFQSQVDENAGFKNR